ncbi:MAG: hypothetical protein JO240_00490 [Solirubrobacterales bacterium]|nr:hypothetical protein [Solirubrobacterales bacterium]
MLDILRRHAGEPVTFVELQAAGIELPASLVSELELAGAEIERCNAARAGERPVRAIRLPSTVGQAPAEELHDNPPRSPTRARTVRPPAQDSEAKAPPAEATSGWGPVRVYRRSLESRLGAAWAGRSPGPHGALLAADAPGRRRRRPSPRMLALLALAVAIVVAVALILVAVAGAKPRPTVQHRATSAQLQTSPPLRPATGARPFTSPQNLRPPTRTVSPSPSMRRA